MSLVGIYPGRASHMHNLDIHQAQKTAEKIEVSKSLSDNNKQNTTDWGAWFDSSFNLSATESTPTGNEQMKIIT